MNINTVNLSNRKSNYYPSTKTKVITFCATPPKKTSNFLPEVKVQGVLTTLYEAFMDLMGKQPEIELITPKIDKTELKISPALPEKIKETSYDRRIKFPELIANRDERKALIDKNKAKKAEGKLDLEYYKDDFRAYVSSIAERLKIVRESQNPELRGMFDSDRQMFQMHEGIMIHGNNLQSKKDLLSNYSEEAKKYGMNVVHIQAGDRDFKEFSQDINKLFPEAKETFKKDRVATMFVIEDIDNMIDKEKMLAAGAINEHVHECGKAGVVWISTVKDLSKIEESCYRGGRVRYTVDIDKTTELSKKD